MEFLLPSNAHMFGKGHILISLVLLESIRTKFRAVVAQPVGNWAEMWMVLSLSPSTDKNLEGVLVIWESARSPSEHC